jgi:Holliday junction resolvase RusA-like endonuclease
MTGTLLLTTDLPIPPSANHRTIITKHGGHDTPETQAFKWKCRSILYNAHETYQDHEATAQARKQDDFLSMTIIFYLPVADKPKRKGTFFRGRDKDNMVQLVQNAVTQHLEIDDVMVIASHIYKLPLPLTEPGYAHVTVSSISLLNVINNAREQEAVNEDTITPIHQTSTANAIHASISQVLADIESTIAAGKSGVIELATDPDA